MRGNIIGAKANTPYDTSAASISVINSDAAAYDRIMPIVLAGEDGPSQ